MRIKSKKYLGKQDVYDVINSDTNNFLLENGVVVHNCIDEANFLEVIEDSKKAALTERYDAAEDMYEAIMNRMASRFMKHGRIPGLLCMISSPRFPDDFLEKKIKQAEELGPISGVFWRKRTLWQAKGKKFFSSGKYFYINTDTLEEVELSMGEKIVAFRNLLIKMKENYSMDIMGKREDYFKDGF